MTKGAKHLRDRWRNEKGEPLRREVEGRLRRGRTLEDLDISEIGGRLDLRGIPFSAAFSEAKGITLKGLDLGAADLANIAFTECEIVDCVLEDAGCRDWRLIGSRVRDTTFVRADLRDSVLSEIDEPGQGSSFERVDFTRANFLRSHCRGATFVGCDFSLAKFARFQFYETALRDCKFRGALQDVLFGARSDDPAGADLLDGVDFSEVTFRDVDFQGLDLRRITLPDDPHLLLVEDARRIEEMLAALPQHDARRHAEARVVLESFREVLDLGGSAVLNTQDFESIEDLLVVAHSATAGRADGT